MCFVNIMILLRYFTRINNFPGTTLASSGVVHTRRRAAHAIARTSVTGTGRPRASLAISLAAAALLSAPGSAPAQEPDLAARVNGEGITRARLQSSIDASNRLGYGNMTQPGAFKRVQRQVLEQLIAQALLWQEARRQGFVATAAEVDEALERLRQKYGSDNAFRLALEENGFTEVSYREDLKRQISVRHWMRETFAQAVAVSDEEVHAFYLANEERFVQPEQINARHVLITVAPDAPEAEVAAARQTIERVLAETKAGADFAALARQHSQGPSAPRGGDLGFFSRGQMVAPFEAAAFALRPGEISDVVRTRFGFHIIKLEAHRAQQTVPEAQAAASIREHLASNRLQEAIAARVQALKEQGSVEILIAR